MAATCGMLASSFKALCALFQFFKYAFGFILQCLSLSNYIDYMLAVLCFMVEPIHW